MSEPSIEEHDLALATQLIEEVEEKKPTLIPTTDISVEGLAPWSVSKYKTLNRCPFAFYLRYVVKIRIPTTTAILTADSVRTDVGKLGHEIVETMIIRDVPFEEALNEVAHDHVKEAITPEFWHMVEDLKTPLREFYARMQALKRKYPVKEFRVEGDLAVDKDWNPTGFDSDNAFLRAKIDLNVVMETGDAILIDHKLGGDPSWGLRNYMFQLETYGLLNTCNHEDIISVTPGIHFMQAMDVITEKKMSRDYLMNRVRKNFDMHLYNAIEHVKEVGKFMAVKGTLCKYCDYRDLCTKYRKPRDKGSLAGLLQPLMETSGDFLKEEDDA